MNDPSTSNQSSPSRYFRFSLRSMLLWTAIVCLVVTNIVTNRQLLRLQRELNAHRPLSPAEVARQFERNTTIRPISVTVKDVRYSADKDSIKVDFSWTDSTTSKTWFSDVILKSDGYGTYSGQIRHTPFLQSLGFGSSFGVAVKAPSPLLE